MNYGVSASTIIPGVKFHSYYDDCRYEQLKLSMPNFVFFSFGAMDSHLKNFTEEKFINSYVQLIQETQNLPSRPLIFLMVPTFHCLHDLKLEGNPNMVDDFIFDRSQCKPEQSRDMTKTIQKIAKKTEIPAYHIVNAWQLVRDPKKNNVASDNVHP